MGLGEQSLDNGSEIIAAEGYQKGLRMIVEAVLGKALRRVVEISHLEREPAPFATLCPAEILKLRLRTGESMTLFAKYLGQEGSGHPNKRRRDREIRVYEGLLTDKHLPTVEYYGAHWDGLGGRHALLLEYVDDWDLRYHGLDHWATAARRLADLHAHFAARRSDLRSCRALLRIDADYLNFWWSAAVQVVVARSQDLGSKLASALRHRDALATILVRQPPTLVHNDLSPKNVVASRSRCPARICLVDWEMAAVGCGVLDMVHVTYGLDPAQQGELHAAYRTELQGGDLVPSDDDEWRRLVAVCQLHEMLYRLARSDDWNLPPSVVARWVDESGELADQAVRP